MEKDDELKGSGKTYTTLFREGDTENGRWWSRDPLEMSMPYQSPYILMDANPVIFTDPFGDSVKVDDLIEKNKNGKLKHPDQVKAFEEFISSEVGNKYIMDRAEKGFKYEFQFVNKGKIITAEKDGQLSSKGIDVEFRVDDLDMHFQIYHNVDWTTGVAHTYGWDYIDRLGNKRLQLVFQLDISSMGILHDVDSWLHETMYHGDTEEKHFLKFGYYKQYADHEPQTMYNSSYGRNSLKILMNVNNKYNLGKTIEQIVFEIQFPGFKFKPKASDKVRIIRHMLNDSKK